MYFRELTLVLLTAYVEPSLSLHVFLRRLAMHSPAAR
jgi:hypothetical protein